jgi:FMN phosphatase YigB (HAD superfamily)/DNA-binding XRE family transcriptional regulator
MDEKTLGNKLQLARKRAGLTQQELCQKAGLSYSTLAKIERGAIKAPSVFTVARIAGATNTPLEELLDLNDRGISSPAPVDTKKRSKSGVRFVYFDVHGTLVRYYQHAFADAGEQLGIPADRVENSFWRHNDDICAGRIGFEELNAAIASELDVPSFDWHLYYMRNVEVIPGVADLVKWTAQYYEIGILSNNMPGFIEELRSKGTIPQGEYKVIIDSSVVKLAKPDPRIYQKAIELAGMQPQEILLIDDTRPYLTAADRSGMQILWFDDMNPQESIERVKKTLAF